MTSRALAQLLEFVRRLEHHGLHSSLAIARDDAVMVTVAVPGERWEVEFFADGTVEVERFRSDGTITDRTALETLIADFGEPTSR
jgi:hypothetical protein